MTFIVSVVGLGKLALLQIHFINGHYSYTTQLLVMERHNTVHHNGSYTIRLAAVREIYWVVKGCVVVKKVIQRYFICRQYDGKKFSYIATSLIESNLATL